MIRGERINKGRKKCRVRIEERTIIVFPATRYIAAPSPSTPNPFGWNLHIDKHPEGCFIAWLMWVTKCPIDTPQMTPYPRDISPSGWSRQA